jgi:diguanylate cyclase (GGDEF)-like protein
LRLSINTWIVLVILLAVLPLLVFSLSATYRLVTEHQAAGQTVLRERTTAAATAVGRLLQSASTTMQTMALSNAAMTGDLPALYDHAVRVKDQEPEIDAISLSASDGRQLFNTRESFGQALPPTNLIDIEKPVFSEGKSIVTPLSTSSITQKRIVGVAVPVRVGGKVEYSLRLVFQPEVIAKVLTDQQWPSDWFVSVIDQNRIIVARTRESQRFVGTPVSETLNLAIRTQRVDVFESISKEGIPLKSTFVKIPHTDWVIATGVPRDKLLAEVHASLLKLLAFGLVSIGLGVCGSMLLARDIGRHVRNFANASMKHAEDTKPSELIDIPIREMAWVSTALAQVKGRASRAKGDLHAARHDALTGLPARALFMEQAAKLQMNLGQHSQGLMEFALLFVDLDGFKQVNDTLGHDAGDQVLKSVAEVLRRCVRDGDGIGRLGGDEFAICIGAPSDRIQAVSRSIAERIVNGVGQIGHGIGCSVGVARGEIHMELALLIDAADKAMLRAKRLGKGQVVEAAEIQS